MTLLTAEDVLNKKFQPTKFREGYDQDEVDDFLDDIVSTLRVIAAENEQLRANLSAAQSRIGDLGGQAVDEGEPITEAQVEFDEPEVLAQPEPEPAAVAEVQPEPAAVAAAPAVGQAQSAAGMLALAQRVHDEFVQNGQSEAERLVTEAREMAEGLVREAEDERHRTLGKLEQQRTLLERKIDELRVFERDYRTRLKSYLEGLLQDVDGPQDVGSNGKSGGVRTIH